MSHHEERVGWIGWRLWGWFIRLALSDLPLPRADYNTAKTTTNLTFAKHTIRRKMIKTGWTMTGWSGWHSIISNILPIAKYLTQAYPSYFKSYFNHLMNFIMSMLMIGRFHNKSRDHIMAWCVVEMYNCVMRARVMPICSELPDKISTSCNSTQ